MSVQELKEKLIEKIREEENEQLLRMVYDWLRQESEVQEPGMTEQDKTGIEKTLEDIKTGKVYSHEQTMAMMEGYLKELESKYEKRQADE